MLPAELPSVSTSRLFTRSVLLCETRCCHEGAPPQARALAGPGGSDGIPGPNPCRQNINWLV